MIYKGKPIKIIGTNGVKPDVTYKFTEIIEDEHGFTVLKDDGRLKREIVIDKKDYKKVKGFQYFKVQRGMKGSFKYITKTTKEEVAEIVEEEKKIKKIKKEREVKAIEKKEIKKDADSFDDLLSSI